MTKSAMIRARVEPELKKEAEEVLAEVGLSPTEAIRLFYRQISLRHGLPFEVRVPNTATRAAISEARRRKGLRSFRSARAVVRASGA
jgi:DNA-damage-inducible protein J